jgi:hypothetical protein
MERKKERRREKETVRNGDREKTQAEQLRYLSLCFSLSSLSPYLSSAMIYRRVWFRREVHYNFLCDFQRKVDTYTGNKTKHYSI